jgi:[ribosomal protein S18]-alanine N-acetyltransferase
MKPIARRIDDWPPIIPSLVQIHSESFEQFWDEKTFLNYVNNEAFRLYVAQVKAQTIGFVLMSVLYEQAEILTLAIRKLNRRQGCATGLMGLAFADLETYGVEKIFLEVAQDNAAALSLYLQLGFMKTGIRKAYYHRKGKPPQDAFMLCRQMDKIKNS